MQKNKPLKGQIAQEALISFVIYTLFILILLGALNHTLPQIQQKQEQKTQQEINVYRCTAIDNYVLLKVKGVELPLSSNGTCITNTEKTSKKMQIGKNYIQDRRQLD